jgi:magnesium-transporting ATPase (P-type)
MDNITLAVIILIVAIPEGLPMVVTVSLAFSVMRMYE